MASETDVSPVGGAARPAQAPDESGTDWEQLAAAAEFRALLARKKTFIVGATIFFIVYYFALPILVGYARDFMEQSVFGPINIAYLFALSQFVMAWVIAAMYARTAARWDEVARNLVLRFRTGGR